MSSSNSTETQLNMSEIESLINAGKFSVSVYSKQTGISQDRIRQAIVSHFGNRVEFRRGRNGGVRLVQG